jgi:hypothetical protein
MYDIFKYDMSILFFVIMTTLIFLIFSYIFFQFYLKFIEFVRVISVNTCQTHISTNTFNTVCYHVSKTCVFRFLKF